MGVVWLVSKEIAIFQLLYTYQRVHKISVSSTVSVTEIVIFKVCTLVKWVSDKNIVEKIGGNW